MATPPSGSGIAPAEIWRETAERLLARLGSTPQGLTAAEARLRLQRCGPNDTGSESRAPVWAQFLGRLGNTLIIILLVASGRAAAQKVAKYVLMGSSANFDNMLSWGINANYSLVKSLG